MAYNSGFPVTYPQYYPQYQQPNMAQVQPQLQQVQIPNQQSQSINQGNSIIWVQGEAGAKSYLVAPNTTVQLWDSEAQTIYLKSADATGMPSIKTLDYTIREIPTQQRQNIPEMHFATLDDINSLKAEIEQIRKEIHSDGKSFVSGNEKQFESE